MVYRLRVGCPWRDQPAVFGLWSSVYARWRRWNLTGLWQKILAVLARGAAGPLRHLDATPMKVHQEAANPAGGQCLHAMSRVQGGLNSKPSALVDGLVRAVPRGLAPSPRADVKVAGAIVPPRGKRRVADKGYDSDGLCRLLEPAGIRTATPPRRHRRAPPSFHRGYYRLRYLVENFFQRLKRFRAVGTRYDKSDLFFGDAVHLAAVIHWLTVKV